MSKTNSATSSHLSSSDEDCIPLTNSKKGVATTSKPISIKKAKSRKEEKSRTTVVKKAVVSKPSTPAKRVAVVSPDEPSAKKGTSSGMFKRLWTEEDEITVLKQMVRYKAEKGVYALSDSKKFHAFVKDALVGGFDRSQVTGKAGKLKLRYKLFRKEEPHPTRGEAHENNETNNGEGRQIDADAVAADDDEEEDDEANDDDVDAEEEDEADDDDVVGDAEDDDDENNETNNGCGQCECGFGGM